jgi:hypothetical protein
MTIDNLMNKYKEISKQIKDLKNEEAVLKAEILSKIQFNPNGQKKVEFAPGKHVVVKAGIGYRVNNERVKEVIDSFPEGFNPFKTETIYKFDKKCFDMLKMYPDLLAIASPCVDDYVKPVSIEVL